jgi:hypothetical protein
VLADHDWTPEFTAKRLVAAFRLLPGRGVYSPVMGDFRSLDGRRIEGLVIIRCAQDALGRRSLECEQLLTWARVKATAGDRWDASISEICREFSGRRGWSRSNFEERRRIALRRLAAWLEAEKARLLVYGQKTGGRRLVPR